MIELLEDMEYIYAEDASEKWQKNWDLKFLENNGRYN